MGSAVTIKDMMTSEELSSSTYLHQCQRQVYEGSNGEDTIAVLAVNID